MKTGLPVSPKPGSRFESERSFVIALQPPPDSPMAASVTRYAMVTLCRARHGLEDKLSAGDIRGARCPGPGPVRPRRPDGPHQPYGLAGPQARRITPCQRHTSATTHALAAAQDQAVCYT